MTVDPQKTDHKYFHDLLLGAVSPRPIALASTVDKQGNVNLSPFSFFNIFSTNPAILVFSPSRRARDNTTKHTLENILETSEVVINTVSYAIVEQVSLASAEYAKDVNEFLKSGLTEIKSERVTPPRVKESPVSFECRVIEVKPLGKQGGAGNLVICEVLLVHVQDDVLTAEGKINPQISDNVARMGGDNYCRVNGENIFELPRPGVPAGIGIDNLPKEIRNSVVLTGNNLGRLANIHQLPSQDEVKAFSEGLENSVSVRGVDRTIAIHKRAQLLLANGEVKKAWLLLLSDITKKGDGAK
jgi:flavin reductase (DIM6/NTAB) family NADH-FMN oxidoreductase RutF